MFKSALLRTITAALLLLSGLAMAQVPLAGTYQESQIGMVVTFQPRADGSLAGTLTGSGGPLPLEVATDTHNAQGTFMLQGTRYGFAAQLQPDLSTLLFWLFQLDANGQAVQGSHEQYSAIRQQTPGAQIQTPASLRTAPPPTNVPGNQLTGNWQGQFQLQGNVFNTSSVFNADGTYREDVFLMGQPVAWYAGTWSLGADGSLHMISQQRSPTLCIFGQCMANDGDPVSVATLSFVGPDNFMMTFQAAPGQPANQAIYQRTGTMPAGGVNGGAIPPGWTPTAPAWGGTPPATQPWTPVTLPWTPTTTPGITGGGPIDHDTFIREIIYEDYGDDDDDDDSGW